MLLIANFGAAWVMVAEPSQRKAREDDSACSSDSAVVDPKRSSLAQNTVSRKSAAVPDGKTQVRV